MRPRAARALLLAAATASGVAALTYETLWTRAFSVILGSTVEAAAATFAAFLVGLALGAFAAGRSEWLMRRAAAGFLAVELATGLLAPLVGLWIHHAGADLAVAMHYDAGPRVLTCFATVLALVLPPTLLMGATFPLLLCAARSDGAAVGAIGRIYALNTAGAALGATLCGFFLIPSIGVTASFGIAAVANLAAALLCLPLALKRSQGESPAAVEPNESAATLPESLLLSIAFASGLCVLGLEIVWSRLASFFLGNRTYAFTALLASVLVLLAAGSALASRLHARYRDRPHALFGAVLGAAALCAALSLAFTDLWIRHQSALEPGLPGAAALLLAYRGAETFLLLGPTLIPLGVLFPLSLMCSRGAANRTGRAAGTYYLLNTAGAVTGSLGVGFWGVTALGAYGSAGVLVAGSGALALVVFAHGAFVAADWRSRRGLAVTAACALALPVLVPNVLAVHAPGEQALFRREDAYGVLQINRRADGLIRALNNRTELIYLLGSPSTAYVQQMQGHLGMFYRPEARRALVLGSGYGITAGALTRYAGLERIDAVEILPGMVEAADLFAPHHFDYHRDPRVHVAVDDGRHFLTTAERRYDLVSINVSDPHLPGGSALFHEDFYEIVKERLEPGGVVLQHAFGTDADVVIRTLVRSFAHVRLVRAYGNGFNAVASDAPLEPDLAAVERVTSAPPVQAALRGIGLLPPITPVGLIEQAATPEDLAPYYDLDGPSATDDRPLLEFSTRGPAALLLFSNE